MNHLEKYCSPRFRTGEELDEALRAALDCGSNAEKAKGYMEKAKEYADSVNAILPDWEQNDQTKFDYIKNRTHWKEVVEPYIPDVLTEEKGAKVGFSLLNPVGRLGVDDGMMDALYADTKYIVKWDNVEYEVVSATGTDGEPYLGNYNLVDSAQPATDYPFCIVWVVSHAKVYCDREKTLQGFRIPISIIRLPEVVYHKLDKKYLPDDIGGGVSSWNDLTDKPFHKETETVVVLPEETRTHHQMGAACPVVVEGATEPIVPGQIYSVSVNGETFELTAYEIEVLGMKIPVLGNPSFCEYQNVSSDAVVGVVQTPMGLTVGVDPAKYNPSYQDDVDVTIGITTVVTTVKEIDKEYLPKHLQFGSEFSGGSVELFPEGEIPFNEDLGYYLPDTIVFESGKTYRVLWGGVEYTCVAESVVIEGITAIIVGNSIEITGVDNGIPFMLIHAPEMLAMMGAPGVGSVIEPPTDDETPATIAIYCEDVTETITHLDSKYLEPFTVRRESEKTIFPETELELKDHEYINSVCGTDLDSYLDLKTGENYTVYVDGAAHTCTARSADYNGVSILWLGNLWLVESMDVELDGEDTGESFCVMSLRTPDGYAITSVINRAEGTIEDTAYSESHTFRIVKDAVNEIKLKPECYDLEWSPNATMVEKEILSETEFSNSGTNGLDYSIGLIAGVRYTVTFNGVEYSCTALEITDAGTPIVLLGDPTFLQAEPSGTFPFLLVEGRGSTMLMLLEAGTIRISSKEPRYERLHHRYMPVYTIPTPFDVIYDFDFQETIEELIPWEEMMAAKQAISHGVKVYGTSRGDMVEVLSVDINDPPYHSAFVLQELATGDIFTVGLGGKGQTPAVDRRDIILHSTTAGSTKKFKITVDDTGTLNATEIA